jgi:integrase
MSQEIHTYFHKRSTENITIWELGVRSHGDSHPRCRHRLYALWTVALAMGLRRGEALGLAWADVDLDSLLIPPARSTSIHRG